ncbi:hypothetical protein LINPERHAP1_LOCUS24017 [Linum perenne]
MPHTAPPPPMHQQKKLPILRTGTSPVPRRNPEASCTGAFRRWEITETPSFRFSIDGSKKETPSTSTRISLTTIEQWSVLRKSFGDIDSAITPGDP